MCRFDNENIRYIYFPEFRKQLRNFFLINWSMIFRSLSCGPIVVCLIMKYISKIFSGIQVLIEEKNSNQSEICKMLFIRCASISWIYDVTNNVSDTNYCEVSDTNVRDTIGSTRNLRTFWAPAAARWAQEDGPIT